MKRIKTILPIAVLSMAFGVFGSIRTEARQTQAAIGDKTILGVQQFLKNIWNNDGNKVTTDAFNYNIGWGSLEFGTAEGPHGFHAFTKNASEGDFISTTAAAIDWGGARFNSVEDNRILLVVEANYDIKVTTSMTSFLGGKDNSEIKYYVIDGAINNGIWYNNEELGLKKTVALDSATANEAGYEATISSGDTFVFEWGFRDTGWARNFNVVESGLSFEIEQLSEPVVKVNNTKTLMFNYVNSVPSYNGGEPYTDAELAPFASFGVYYGSVANGQLNKFENVAVNDMKSASGKVIVQNWTVTFGQGENYILRLTAAEKMLLTVSRPESGTEWLINSTLNMYKNDKLIKTVTFETEPTSDMTAFDCVKVLNTGDTFTFELSYEDSRNISMKSGGDINTSMPQFLGEGFANAPEDLHPTHTLVEKEGTAATCTKEGLKAHYECSVCDEMFEDEEGTSPATAESLKIPATGHKSIVEVPAVAPGCTTDGHIKYYQCSDCKALFKDEAGAEAIDDLATWLAGDGKVAATGHKSIVEVPAVAPGCTTDGHAKYYQCSDCEALFKDQAATQAIDDLTTWLAGEGKVAATGHTYGKPVITWSDDHKCTQTVTCTKDSTHSITQTVQGILTEITAPSCETAGSSKYVATFTEDELTKTVESEPFEVAATGHSYGAWTVVEEPTTEAAGSRIRECSICEDVETQTLPKLDTTNYTYTVLLEPTVNAAGLGQYASDVYGTYQVTIAKLEEAPAATGCGGSIVACAGLISLLTLAGASLLVSKKHD